MKLTSLRNALIGVPLVIVAAHADLASAHTLLEDLGPAAGATDLYKVTCYTIRDGLPTFRLAARIQDRLPKASPLVSVQTFKASKASNTTDLTDGPSPVGVSPWSPWTYNNGGNGVYFVLVDKSGPGAESYALETHCEAKNGSHTGEVDPAQKIQDQ